MTFHFTKMHALGNDFIIIDGVNQKINLSSEQIRILSHRHTGIGFDQCLVVEKSDDFEVDFFYRIFNANGQEVGQCGNGARCLALFLQRYHVTLKTHIVVATKTTTMQLHIGEQDVTVTMPVPIFEPEKIPLNVVSQQERYAIPLANGDIISIHALSVGNPHAVVIVEEVEHTAVSTIGKELSEHTLFPEQANIGFMQIINPRQIKLRVYERGCGETNACGSGAVAAAVVGRLFYAMDEQITVNLRGGSVLVTWPNKNTPIQLSGTASFVYEGTVLLE